MITDQQKINRATGGLSHLIGAYYLLGSIICDCNPQESKEMKQILLHAKGIYWSILKMRYGIENPKRDNKSGNNLGGGSK